MCEVDGKPPQYPTHYDRLCSACALTLFVADCYCGDKAPVWKVDDKFCEVPCKNGRGEGRNCGGWGFMTVFHNNKPVPARPGWPSPNQGTGGGVTYKGCYNVKENAKIFGKVVETSRWMTNEVRWERCILTGGRSSPGLHSGYISRMRLQIVWCLVRQFCRKSASPTASTL